MLGVVAILLVCLSGILYYVQRTRSQGHPRSLAILPFQSLHADSTSDFLGFSLADAVITKLGTVRSLVVRPSSAVEKYRQSVDFRQAAAELHVDTLLTGNYLRDGDDLRITSQLIDVSTQNIYGKVPSISSTKSCLRFRTTWRGRSSRASSLSLSPLEVERLRNPRSR